MTIEELIEAFDKKDLKCDCRLYRNKEDVWIHETECNLTLWSNIKRRILALCELIDKAEAI